MGFLFGFGGVCSGFFVVGVGSFLVFFSSFYLLSCLNYVPHVPSKHGTVGFSLKFLLFLLLPLARFLSLLKVLGKVVCETALRLNRTDFNLLFLG